MTQDEIITMARQAGWSKEYLEFGDERLERFAKLVAQHEREACAKLCDDLDDDLPDGLAGWQYGEAIRARGQA
jgi:hypothetical protein